ncbi:M15 family metallopeptidase [uncultured Proteiniphilum sp.]|uniref:M15 family metallopeptidase n=1 Tax=uncultured Proteiniphilum sp. TaxID=497637 RepID=UPI0026356426|nr:M15 family metallopeptidase [uncultured Proteiniphilum sp.]
MKILLSLLLVLCFFCSCTEYKKEKQSSEKGGDPGKVVRKRQGSADTIAYGTFSNPAEEVEPVTVEKDTIIDAGYSFEESIAGTKASQSIIDQLELFEVFYLSVDGKIHQGQILSNRKIAEDIREIFRFMRESGFVVEKVVPVVRYGWNDSLSMDDNNSYSFCYRDITYSKHATGMAIDINPRFNPIRWKTENRPNQPQGAVLDTTINGTLYPGHPVVEEFRKFGFRWGHSFTKFYDDHHFEKR